MNDQIIPARGFDPDDLSVRLNDFLQGKSPEKAVELLNGADALLRFAREVRSTVHGIILDYVEENGAFTVGDVVFCAANVTDWKPKDTKAIAAELLGQTDVDGFVACLRSDPFKQSSVRAIVGQERHAQLYNRVTKLTLEKKPVKRLARVQTRYLPHPPAKGQVVEVDDAADELANHDF